MWIRVLRMERERGGGNGVIDEQVTDQTVKCKISMFEIRRCAHTSHASNGDVWQSAVCESMTALQICIRIYTLYSIVGKSKSKKTLKGCSRQVGCAHAQQTARNIAYCGKRVVSKSMADQKHRREWQALSKRRRRGWKRRSWYYDKREHGSMMLSEIEERVENQKESEVEPTQNRLTAASGEFMQKKLHIFVP